MENSVEGLTMNENTQNKQPNGANNAESETPLVVLKTKRSQVTIGALFLIIGTLCLIFGVFLPVLRTGNYSAIWGGNPVKGFILFYLSWFAIPGGLFYILLFLHHKEGAGYFYKDRLEIYTFWFERRIIIPYVRMHVVQGKMAVRISTQSLPDWSRPWQRFKVMYWESVGFLTIFHDPKVAGIRTGFNRWYENPEDGPKAMQILKEKAFSFIEK